MMAIRLISPNARSAAEPVGAVVTAKLSDDGAKIQVTEKIEGEVFYSELDVAWLMDKPAPKIFPYKLDPLKHCHYSMPRMRELVFNTDATSYVSIVVNPEGDLFVVLGRDKDQAFTLTADSMEPEIYTPEQIAKLEFCDFEVPLDRYTAVRRRILSRVYLIDSLYLLEKQVDIQNRLLIQMADALAANGVEVPQDMVSYIRTFDQYSMLSYGFNEAVDQVIAQKQNTREVQIEAETLIQ